MHYNYDLVGVWGLGLATSTVRLDSVPLGMDQQSWVLTSDGTTMHNGEVITKLSKKPAEGDVLVSCGYVCREYSGHF